MSRRETWADRLTRRLLPYLGPPPLGPYDEPEQKPVATRSCPMCGHPMGEHRIERPGGNASSRLHCPVSG